MSLRKLQPFIAALLLLKLVWIQQYVSTGSEILLRMGGILGEFQLVLKLLVRMDWIQLYVSIICKLLTLATFFQFIW